MTTTTLPLDLADHIETPEDVALFLEASFDGGTPAEIAHALGIVARSTGMAALAEKAGVPRQTLYKALSTNGNPSLDTFVKIIRALGLKLTAEAA